MHPRPGTEVGIRAGEIIAEKYRVDRILGVGGMGVVVAAHHLQLEELVAIKVLLPDALADADAVRRFEREARAAFKIKSEHVTRIIDVDALASGAPFIVMEYLAGEDLADRIDRAGPLAVGEAIDLILQACEAIAEAHALGIVHRDLKPANLFCIQGADGRPSIKVLDFGISKLTSAPLRASALGMTKTRAVMGSPYYMSPEQMQSPRTVDTRTDIWSLGVVLHQLLTGDVPFTGETLPQVCVNVATEPAPPLRTIRPDVPAGLEMIVLRCLEKDRNRRYPTIGALATALARFGSKRAQASLERIARISDQADEHREDGARARHERATDRPVTGPLPSWGRTERSSNIRSKSLAGWVAGSLIVGSAGFTFAVLRTWMRPTSSPAVLITPAQSSEAREAIAQPSSVQPIRTAEPASSGPVIASTSSARSQAMALPSDGFTPRTAPLPSSAAALPSPGTAAPPSHAQPAPESGRLALGSVPSKTEANSANAAELARAASREPSGTVLEEVNPYAPVSAPATPATLAATCTLNLNSMPPAQVLLDGNLLGFTPRMGVVATTGEHHVVFRRERADKHATVTCTQGETKTVAVRLSETSPEDERLERNPYR